MSAVCHPVMTVEEYLDLERSSTVKHEYFAGAAYAMVGAKLSHVRIVGSTYALLYEQLRGRGGCNIDVSDLRVRTPGGLLAYPDIVVVRGEDEVLRDERGDTLLNPTLIAEVLSPSTEAYDRGFKFEQYKLISSLREYVLIAQDRPRVERYLRQLDGQWLYTDIFGLHEQMRLESVDCVIELARLYERVRFD